MIYLYLVIVHSRLNQDNSYILEGSVSYLPEHNEEIELSIEFPVVMMVGSSIWTSHVTRYLKYLGNPDKCQELQLF